MTDQIDATIGGKTIKPTKIDKGSKPLSQRRGSSLGDINAATCGQGHSIRAFLTGLRKTGVNLKRQQRRDGATGFRIVNPGAINVATIDA